MKIGLRLPATWKRSERGLKPTLVMSLISDDDENLRTGSKRGFKSTGWTKYKSALGKRKHRGWRVKWDWLRKWNRCDYSIPHSRLKSWLHFYLEEETFKNTVVSSNWLLHYGKIMLKSLIRMRIIIPIHQTDFSLITKRLCWSFVRMGRSAARLSWNQMRIIARLLHDCWSKQDSADVGLSSRFRTYCYYIDRGRTC